MPARQGEGTQDLFVRTEIETSPIALYAVTGDLLK
jgi:hypothetical protein